MRRIHHEDFGFHDDAHASGREPERDEQEARQEERARRQAVAQVAPPVRPLHLRIAHALHALLSARTLL